LTFWGNAGKQDATKYAHPPKLAINAPDADVVELVDALDSKSPLFIFLQKILP
jgi:hypothetical protein